MELQIALQQLLSTCESLRALTSSPPEQTEEDKAKGNLALSKPRIGDPEAATSFWCEVHKLDEWHIIATDMDRAMVKDCVRDIKGSYATSTVDTHADVSSSCTRLKYPDFPNDDLTVTIRAGYKESFDEEAPQYKWLIARVTALKDGNETEPQELYNPYNRANQTMNSGTPSSEVGALDILYRSLTPNSMVFH